MWTAETVLMCALALLARGTDSFPAIVLLNPKPLKHPERFWLAALDDFRNWLIRKQIP